MRYVSLDTETTGLDHTRHALLELALVLEDTATAQRTDVEALPAFIGYVRHEDAVWSNHCLGMHAGKPCMLAQLPTPAETHFATGDIVGHVWPNVIALEDAALAWLHSHGFSTQKQATVAGKNYGAFDRGFLPPRLRNVFNRRALDPGSLLVDWSRDELLSLKELTGREPAHTAIEDARDVVRVLRRVYTSAPLTTGDEAWARNVAGRL